MICKKVKKRFEKKGSVRRACVRTVCLCLPIVFVFSLLVFLGFAFAVPVCSIPGNDGVGTPSSVINTYYPETSSVSAGALSIRICSPSGLGIAMQYATARLSSSNQKINRFFINEQHNREEGIDETAGRGDA